MTLEPEEIEELRESFEYNDFDGDGRITLDEFVEMMNQLEAGMSLEEARVGFADIDIDGDGMIDFDEFAAWWGEP
jgi:Ca2+-binding EF-hand superfamily protein